MPMSSTDSEPTSPAGGQPRPPMVTAARWVFIIAAVLMVLAGLILASAHYTGHEDSDFIHAWERNMRIVGIANVLLGCAIGFTVAPMSAGNRRARVVLIALTAGGIALNIMAFVIHVGGFVLALIAVLLAIAVMCMVQPSARSYFGVRSLWQ